MADDQRPKGPTMLVATEALQPPKLRIGKIGNNFTLPRTVSAVKLITGAVSALVAVGIFGSFTGYTLSAVMYSATIGAVLGVSAVSYSPLRDESLARWLGLKLKSRKGKTRTIRGKPVRLAVGVCYVEPSPRGPVQLVPGAIQVRAGTFDERGVRIAEMRWRSVDRPVIEYVPEKSRLDAYHSAAGARTGASAMEAFRAASLNPELPEDLVPSSTERPKRRRGRWEQDPDLLRRLYTAPSIYPEDDDLNPFQAEQPDDTDESGASVPTL